MKCYLDSNVLAYYKDDTSRQHQLAVDTIFKLRYSDAEICLSPLCLDEVVHAALVDLRRKRTKNIFPELTRFLGEILEIPGLKIINPPIDVESQKSLIVLMEKFNLRPRDAYHLLTMQANNIDTFATFDNDFSKVFEQKILFKA